MYEKVDFQFNYILKYYCVNQEKGYAPIIILNVRFKQIYILEKKGKI